MGPLPALASLARQVEHHAFLQQRDLLSFCNDNGIVLMSYGGLAPLTKADASKPTTPLMALVSDLAAKYGVQQSHVLQRWMLQGGKGVVTTSTKTSRIASALKPFSFALTDAEVRQIDDAGAAAPEARYFFTQHHAAARL